MCGLSCSSCGQSSAPVFVSSQSSIPPSRIIYPQREEQQRRSVDAAVEQARKRREEQEEGKLERILDLQTKSQEELCALQSSVADHQRKLESLQSAISSAETERLRGMQEVHDQHIVLSKLKIEEGEHNSRLKQKEDQLQAREAAFAEKVGEQERELQEKKNWVDMQVKTLSQENVSSSK